MKLFIALAKTKTGTEVGIATTRAANIEDARPVLERFADMTSSGSIRIIESSTGPDPDLKNPSHDAKDYVQEVAEEAPIVRTRKSPRNISPVAYTAPQESSLPWVKYPKLATSVWNPKVRADYLADLERLHSERQEAQAIDLAVREMKSRKMVPVEDLVELFDMSFKNVVAFAKAQGFKVGQKLQEGTMRIMVQRTITGGAK